MSEIFDSLLGLAEVAVALAGFSAVVIVLRRSADGRWDEASADKFHGMIIHAICAVAFSFLPSLLNVLVQDVTTTLHIACGVLGVQILGHCIGVALMPTSKWLARAAMILGALIGALQFAAFTDWGINRELDIYIVGVIWHILQAGMLFVLLIWIDRDEIEAD